jgi:hypothetical protein
MNSSYFGFAWEVAVEPDAPWSEVVPLVVWHADSREAVRIKMHSLENDIAISL